MRKIRDAKFRANKRLLEQNHQEKNVQTKSIASPPSLTELLGQTKLILKTIPDSEDMMMIAGKSEYGVGIILHKNDIQRFIALHPEIEVEDSIIDTRI